MAEMRAVLFQMKKAKGAFQYDLSRDLKYVRI